LHQQRPAHVVNRSRQSVARLLGDKLAPNAGLNFEIASRPRRVAAEQWREDFDIEVLCRAASGGWRR
jgi:hypothetical protein